MYKLRDWLGRFRFAQAAAGVVDAPPMRVGAGSSLRLLTQLQHKDVLMALVAFKSFAAQVPVGGVFIVDDGSLEPSDRSLLRDHLPGVEFLDRTGARSPACPVGGCWERLLWIERLARDRFVVQLDSDTLTLGPIGEVADCVAQGRSFAIGTWDDQEVEPLLERRDTAARVQASQPGPHHVQLVAEANFNAIADAARLRYIRGCAGFSGFAPGSVDLAFVESVSAQMTAKIGDAWKQWGSEQVMSNLVVANSPDPFVLPHPDYCDCTRIRPGRTRFVHFIGSCRFTGGTYAHHAREAVAALAAAAAPA